MTAPSPSVPSRTPGHRKALEGLIAKFKTSHPEAASAELESIDADNHVAILSDRTIMSVNGDDRRKVVNLLASQCKPSAGEQVDDYWSRQYHGFHMVEFHPYEGQAIFERLTKEQVRARNIIASKLGIKPWQVRVARAKDGGWRCRLDKEIIYQPSKHDKAMAEACVLVGHPGWWFEADSKTGVIDVHGRRAGQLRTRPSAAAGDAWRARRTCAARRSASCCPARAACCSSRRPSTGRRARFC